MSALVIEHVKFSELPETWRANFPIPPDARVTVRIETEAEQTSVATNEPFMTDDPAFGIWRDREDVTDVEAYVRKQRAPRYNRDGSRNEG